MEGPHHNLGRERIAACNAAGRRRRKRVLGHWTRSSTCTMPALPLAMSLPSISLQHEAQHGSSSRNRCISGTQRRPVPLKGTPQQCNQSTPEPSTLGRDVAERRTGTGFGREWSRRIKRQAMGPGVYLSFLFQRFSFFLLFFYRLLAKRAKRMNDIPPFERLDFGQSNQPWEVMVVQARIYLLNNLMDSTRD